MIISVISIIGKSLTIRGPDTARSTGPPGPNRRARRSALVALARRLVIALWRYLKDGIIPDGAQFKPA
jgi:hypothetical protein